MHVISDELIHGSGRLAQLVEHLVYTERVGSSRLSPPTIAFNKQRS